ncbi:MAG TPA: hypothetical protein VIL35_08180 [Vicinamibacterales bacterium]
MWFRRSAALLLACVAILASVQCGRGLFRQYEYEEEIYLKLDGSADIVVNTSIPALAALRGAKLDTRPETPVNRDAVRAFYESAGVQVTRVSRPWRRHGRRFVQIRIETDDIRELGRAAPFAWSTYEFKERDGQLVYVQKIGSPAGVQVPDAGWDGSELIAVRMHVPSRIQYHNSSSREVQRGNILAWEQPLADRLAGKPLEIEVRMETESILARTLTIFGLSAGAALALLAAIVLWVRRQGRAQAAS